MTHTLRLVLAGALWSVVPHWHRRWIPTVILAMWSLPLAMLGTCGVLLAKRWRRLRGRRHDDAVADAEVVILGELVALGLAAGMTFVEALRRAGSELDSELRDEVDGVVRAIRKDGSHAVLESATGRARRLYVLAGRAMLTGAPLLDAVEVFVDEARSEERARRQAAVRRLPVTLVLPLALLILPGFVIVVLAPAVVGSLQQFSS